jgi:hypothetical protein
MGHLHSPLGVLGLSKAFLMDLVLAQEVGLKGFKLVPNRAVLSSGISVSTMWFLPRCGFIATPFSECFASLESWLEDEEFGT